MSSTITAAGIGSIVTGIGASALDGGFEVEITQADLTVPPPHTMCRGYYKFVNSQFMPKTQEEIAIMTFTENKENMQAANRISCQEHIYASYPIQVQDNMSLGLYTTAECDVMCTFIAACITEENRVFGEIDLATTQAELDAVTTNWPVA